MSLRSPWTLQDVLGQGSYGKVYRAQHSGTGQVVALKQLCLRRVRAESRERAVRDEISTLQCIMERYENGHPNILRLFEHFRTSSSIFIVTELCAGGDVAELLKRCQGRPMAPAIVRGLVKQLAAGLQVLRAQDLVHRDLKPANLLLTHSDPHDPACTLKIADFGFSRTLAVGDLAATLVGSPLYVAPELLAFKSYDEKADLWSVGCILVEMLSGVHPFRVSLRGREATNQIALRGNIQAYFKHHAALVVPPTGYCALGEAQSEHGPLSADTVSLLQALLRPNPADRASFDAFFNHPALLPPPPGAEADEGSALPATAASPADGAASEEGSGAAAPAPTAGAVPAVSGPGEEGDDGFVLVQGEDWDSGGGSSGGSVEDLAVTAEMGAPPAPSSPMTPPVDSAPQSEVAALRAENEHLRTSLQRAESERAAAAAHSVALDLESQVRDAEVEWSCQDIAMTQDLMGMSCSAMGAVHSSAAGAGPGGALAPLPSVTTAGTDDDDDDDQGDGVEGGTERLVQEQEGGEEGSDSAPEDEQKGGGGGGGAPPASSVAPAAPAAEAERALEPEPLISFLGLDVGDLGLFIRSDDDAGAAPSFMAFSDPAVAPCSLTAQCAMAAPAGAAFMLGRVTALSADGSGARVATIEQLHFDCGGGAQVVAEAYAPPDEAALGSVISFRHLGVGRIVLFFHTGVGEQYVAFNQGQSNWYLARESVILAARRAREARVGAAGSVAGSELPAFVYGEVVMVAEHVTSAEHNPYQLPEGVSYNEATVALLGLAPV